ncbi:hypothetical protein [Ornithinimicrobium sp. Y1694]|uniref:hypothetical protein n=1 Tax=Ornithinimicrobium sp. Y1694 TaxID=3418590 RepID=UPI003CF2B402
MMKLTLGAHEAILDLVAGTGVLLDPLPEDDVFLDSPTGLHGASWESAMRQLHGMGWELVTEDDGYPVSVGRHADGRDALGLIHVV